LSLCFFLTEHHTMKVYWGSRDIVHTLTSALNGSEWSALCPSGFTPRERTLGIDSVGGWVGPRASLDMVVKRKIPSPCWDSYPQLSSP